MISVQPAEGMDDELLTKHLNARHVATDYAGLGRLSGGLIAIEARGVRERYHRYCHEFGEYDHEHSEG
jgi:hypothetical protein